MRKREGERKGGERQWLEKGASNAPILLHTERAERIGGSGDRSGERILTLRSCDIASHCDKSSGEGYVEDVWEGKLEG